MCGICGVIQLRGEPREVVAPDVLDRMTDAMTHRGPDDRGTYLAPGVALGVRRLSIVDVEGGHQPFANEDGRIWAIQNGELYNHAEVRELLRRDGHSFRSRCDTEVLPHLYERFGTRFPEELVGMFGIVVWDERRRRAVLARDRLGVKPLYYADTGESLVFASELKSLLASGLVTPDLDYEAIDMYLSLGFFPAPRTPLAGVAKLEPGCILIAEDDEIRVERYWEYPVPEPRSDLTFSECQEELLARLEESVRLRLMSDVPLGAMLSGGLDSSLIVAMMARNMAEPVKTFSVGFVEAGAANELGDAREVAAVLGTDHHELELSFTSEGIDLQKLVWHMDEPLADLSAIGFLALSELASQHVKVALCGQGADELLGGYTGHRTAAAAGLVDRVPASLRKTGLSAAAHGPRRLRKASRLLALTDPVDRLLATQRGFDEGLKPRLVRGPLASVDGGGLRSALERVNARHPDPLEAMLYLDARLGLVDDMLHYFDRASMAHSLEVRVPFLDHRFVEYCATIPGSFKVRRLRTKALLKEASRGLVPDRIIDKRKNGFFNRSMGSWLEAQTAGAISDYLLGPNPRYAELLDRAGVEELIARHGRGEPGNARPLLSILMLEIWLQTYLPLAARGASGAGLALTKV